MIKNISLLNIRNHKKLDLSFNNNFVYIKGANGSGKTSILESIHIVSTSKSHRTNNDFDVVQRGADFGVIKIQTETNNYQVVISGKGKVANINGKEISKLSDLVGSLHTVMFSPEDLNIVKGSPSIRRNFIDLELLKINKVYLNELVLYKRLLKQRNSLLKTLKLEDDLTLLNVVSTQLLEVGSQVLNIKKEFIKKLDYYTKITYKLFSNNEVEIKYDPSVTIEEFKNHLLTNQKQDILYKTTTQGPHRDDLTIHFNKTEAKNASQGEIRLIVVSMKLALIKLIKEELNIDVVLLLDDVLSELDSSVQNKFLTELPKNMQIIMNSAINVKSDNIQIIDLEGVK